MELSNVSFPAHFLRVSRLLLSAPSGSLALRYEAEKRKGGKEVIDHHRVHPYDNQITLNNIVMCVRA